MWNPAILYPVVLTISDLAMAALVGAVGVSVACATALGDPLTDNIGSEAGSGLKS